MSLNKKIKNTFWYFDDENNMMLHQNYGLVFDNGKHDGAEKSCHAFYAYNDYSFISGLSRCKDIIIRTNPILAKLFGKSYFQFKRYPKIEWYHEPMSRDHWIYILVAIFKAMKSHIIVNEFVRSTRIQLSKTNWLTLKVWAWGKLLSKRTIGYLFYPLALWSIILNKYWNIFIRKIGKFGEEWSQEDYVNKPHPVPTKFQKFIRGFMYPVYALKLIAFMLDVLPDNWWKRQIKRQSWSIIPKYNYALQLLLDSPNQPTLEDIQSYKSMKGDRWSQELNPLINPRTLEVIDDPVLLKYNRLDYDFIMALYNNKH